MFRTKTQLTIDNDSSETSFKDKGKFYALKSIK